MHDFFYFSRILILVNCFLLCTACSDSPSRLPGYIEGEYTYIASDVSGILFNLAVQRGQQVNTGEPLYILDPEPEKSMLKVAQANVYDLQAQLVFSKLQLDRQKNLFKKNATTQMNLDQAQTDFDSKTQQLQSEQAQLVKAQWTGDQKNRRAPVMGEVFDTFYRVGELVPADHPVLAILGPRNILVLYYVPEKILKKVKKGEAITFTCDGCKGKTKASIDYISPRAEYTPPVIYSKDSREKLVYLVRARMPEVIAKQFHPGQPVDVKLH